MATWTGSRSVSRRWRNDLCNDEHFSRDVEAWVDRRFARTIRCWFASARTAASGAACSSSCRRRTALVVEGVNIIKRHTKPNPQKNIKGGIVEREASIHLSNVMLIDPESNEPTRIGSKTLGDGRRVRIGRKSGAVVDK